jgi:hypothetical protein
MPKAAKKPAQEEVLPVRFTTFNIPPLYAYAQWILNLNRALTGFSFLPE